jgi:hypothetical protein
MHFYQLLLTGNKFTSRFRHETWFVAGAESTSQPRPPILLLVVKGAAAILLLVQWEELHLGFHR